MEAAFGDLTPWSDPSWYQGHCSPYYSSTHIEWRSRVRSWLEEHVIPFAPEWEENAFYEYGEHDGQVDHLALQRKFAEAGLLPAVLGGEWPEQYTTHKAPQDYDVFHNLILLDELARASPDSASILSTGYIIAGRPVFQFGSEELKRRVVPSFLKGDTNLCLCMSEPSAGSDVSALSTTAEKTEDGQHFIVNGEKKWITGGLYADYFVVAARTGVAGPKGLSLLLLEKEMIGLTCKKMKCTGSWASGTTYVTMEDVKVPRQNLMGKENGGFKLMMFNLNHERWYVAALATRNARTCLEEAILYSQKRKTFGKKLIEHQAIRLKIAQMAAHVESTWSLVEHIAYQMKEMPEDVSRFLLGGQTALLKVKATQTFEYCAREASQILGGSSYVRTGQGARLEKLLRVCRAFAIFAGSEEVLMDLATRMSMKLQQATKQMAGH